MSIYRDTMDFAFRRFSGSMVRWTFVTTASRTGQLGNRRTVRPYISSISSEVAAGRSWTQVTEVSLAESEKHKFEIFDYLPECESLLAMEVTSAAAEQSPQSHQGTFGLMDKWARLASVVPGLLNAVNDSPPSRIAKSVLRIEKVGLRRRVWVSGCAFRTQLLRQMTRVRGESKRCGRGGPPNRQGAVRIVCAYASL